MAITRVWVEDGCISCGSSGHYCPKVFEVVDDIGATVIEGVDYSLFEEDIKAASTACPIQVIKYEET
jgi:ferredoxin